MTARLVGGRYQLQTMLGRGGMATVWRGVDTRLDRPVAVKILDAAAWTDPIMLQRLDREARTVARLAHPNIVAVYDLGADGDVPYLVMELVDGENLQHRLARGPLDVPQVVEITSQICAALAAAHEAGVVHRDIKPDNILLTPAGVVKVCDFGIARLQRAAQANMTSPAMTIGTSEYMAPEQAAGEPVDARTDLYALGCVLYAMFTGNPPFTGSDPMRVLWQQVNQPPPPLTAHRPDVPTDLAALVDQLLAKNPADRPITAEQVSSRLAHAASLAGVLLGRHSPLIGQPHPGQPGAAPISTLPDQPITVTGPSGTAVHPAVAGDPIRPAARATVVSRTQNMPALEPNEQPAPTRGGFRLGPAGIAAVAIGAAALAAIVVAGIMLMTTPEQLVAGPGTASSTTVAPRTKTTTTAPANNPAEQIGAVQAALRAQVQAGQVDDNAAADLTDRLDEIARLLVEDDRKAAKKVNEVIRKFNEFRRDGKVTAAAYDAISPSLEQLATIVRSNSDGRD